MKTQRHEFASLVQNVFFKMFEFFNNFRKEDTLTCCARISIRTDSQLYPFKAVNLKSDQSYANLKLSMIFHPSSVMLFAVHGIESLLCLNQLPTRRACWNQHDGVSVIQYFTRLQLSPNSPTNKVFAVVGMSSPSHSKPMWRNPGLIILDWFQRCLYTACQKPIRVRFTLISGKLVSRNHSGVARSLTAVSVGVSTWNFTLAKETGF